jgi:membrane peptidoglycan carboxypeptidase
MPTKVKWALFAGFVVVVVLSLMSFYDLVLRVPDFTQLKESVDVPIRLANGKAAMRRMGPRAPGWTSLSAVSEWLPRAVISSEDASFYSHKGIDVHEIREAFKKDWKEGRFARGASTLTQQVLKNVYLYHYPRLWRKVKELAWAPKLEAALSKPQILSFYLNMAEWGPGIYGVGEAARHYFSISPAGLSPRQAAFLAMLLPSPRRYHAYFREKKLTAWANKRVNRILEVMNKLGQLPAEAYESALTEKLWGAEVVADTSPGAPSDPGWDAAESPEEVFEKTSEGSLAPPAAEKGDEPSQTTPTLEPAELEPVGEVDPAPAQATPPPPTETEPEPPAIQPEE